MTFNGYTKTEQTPSKLLPNGYCKILTSINQPVTRNRYESLILGRASLSFSSIGTTIYCQNEDDTDTSYKVLNTTAWDGGVAEYSSTDSDVPIYSAITDDSIFTTDQNLSEHNVLWTIYYYHKVENIPSGTTAYALFEFYKVDADDNETLLFDIEGQTSTIGIDNGFTTTGYPAGEVETTDRLLIKIYHKSRVPS